MAVSMPSMLATAELSKAREYRRDSPMSARFAASSTEQQAQALSLSTRRSSCGHGRGGLIVSPNPIVVGGGGGGGGNLSDDDTPLRRLSSAKPPSSSRPNNNKGERPRSTAGAVTRIVLDTEEVEALICVLQSDALVLAADVVVAGEVVPAGAELVEVGPYCKRRLKASWLLKEHEVRRHLGLCVEERRTCLLGFRTDRLAFPWCFFVHRPGCSVVTVLLVAISQALLLGSLEGSTAFAYFGQISTSFESWTDADGPASLKHKAFRTAFNDKMKKESARRLAVQDNMQLLEASLRRSRDGDLFRTKMASLIYAPKNPSVNLLSASALREIHDIETELRALPRFRKHCGDIEQYSWTLCSYGVSLANYVYPEQPADLSEGSAGPSEELILNGAGKKALPVSLALRIAEQENLHKVIFTKEDAAMAEEFEVIEGTGCDDEEAHGGCERWRDLGYCAPSSEHANYMRDFCRRTCGYCQSGGASRGGHRVTALRTVFYMRGYCCNRFDGGQVQGVKAYDARWLELVDDMAGFLEGKETDNVRVLFTSDGFEELVALRAMAGDLTWAIGAYVFVFVYATLHTRSPILAIVGQLIVMTSIPCSAGIFKVASRASELSAAMLLAVFIIVGIGSDMLFVYTEFWKQSLSHTRDPVRRMRHLYAHAATATAATTFTTATSFLANLFNSLRPLREFGLFMGVCVTFAWLLVLLAYPPALLFAERAHRRLCACLRRLSPLTRSIVDSKNCDDTVVDSDADHSVASEDHASDTRGDHDLDVDVSLPRAAHDIRRLDIDGCCSGDRSATAGGEDCNFSMDDFDTSSKPESLFVEHGPSEGELSGSSRLIRSILLATINAFDPEKDGVGMLYQNMFGPLGVKLIARFRWVIIVLFGALTSVMLGVAMSAVEQSVEPPRTFSPDHPLEQIRVLVECFHEVPYKDFDSDYRLVSVKRIARCTGALNDCELGSCPTTGRAVGSPGLCQCYSNLEARSSEGDGFTSNASTTLLLGPSCTKYDLQVVAIGDPTRLHASHFDEAAFLRYIRAQHPGTPSLRLTTSGGTRTRHLFTDHWESGRSNLAVLLVLPPTTIDVREGSDNPSRDNVCKIHQLCYCGVERCVNSTFAVGDLEFAGVPKRRLNETHLVAGALHAPLQDQLSILEEKEDSPMLRLLAEQRTAPVTPASKRATVVIVFGLLATGTQPLLGTAAGSPYMFSGDFHFEDVWVQRHTVRLCDTWPAKLKVVTHLCWVAEFRDYVKRMGYRWPLDADVNVHSLAFSFSSSVLIGRNVANKYVWFNEENKVKGMYVEASIDVSSSTSPETSSDMMARWDAHIAAYDASSKTYKGVWHTSSLWVRGEAETVILRSTFMSICISLGCVLVGCIAFTRSLQLALIVMIMVLSVVGCLFFYMVVIMSWKVGAVEVVSLIIFVGFAVDYSLHLSHKYSHCHITVVEVPRSKCDGVKGAQVHENDDQDIASVDQWRIVATDEPDLSEANSVTEEGLRFLFTHRREERYERTRFAVQSLGSALVGSAATTIGCAAFLVPCTLVIFKKIGFVVLGVTFFAIIYTVLPLPAVLFVLGPTRGDCAYVLRLLASLLGGPRDQPPMGKPSKRQLQDGQRRPLGCYADDPFRDASTAGAADGPTDAAQRRFVLNMPVRGMGVSAKGVKASRMQINATG
eukprot:TRINITY_DN24564_c0_g1_i1.p1 TRINITY_DN24564_c0_g1~~TRINITY_DN24564_c0_g1_i1.p1  ORF type:complete len:1660 (-),score=318.38 TRINITY_DN24564_c0_g1_i1:106-5085(-)